MSRILVLGGSGFVGRHVVNRLVVAGHTVVVPTRLRERAKHLILLPTVDVVTADVHRDAELDALVAGSDAVINLVGVLHSPPGTPWGAAFERAHVALPRRLAAACARLGVTRLIQMSAVGAADNAPSEYLRSRAAGEAALLAVRDRVDTTVFRPSVVFGPEDRLLNLFATMQRWLPVVLLACPEAKFQPVFVGDVAECIVHALSDTRTHHRNYDLCGPRVHTLRELVAFAGQAAGCARPIIGLPEGLSMLQAAMMEWLPVKLMSRDNVRSMRVPSVCDCEFPFGIQPQGLESAAAWLAGANPRARLDAYRVRAGR